MTNEIKKIYIVSYTLYLEGKGKMQGQVFADSSYPDLVRKVLKNFEHWCDTTFDVKSIEVEDADNLDVYKVTITHPSWSEPFVEFFIPESRLNPFQKLFLHIVRNTLLDDESIEGRWQDDNWLSDIGSHLDVVESSYTIK